MSANLPNFINFLIFIFFQVQCQTGLFEGDMEISDYVYMCIFPGSWMFLFESLHVYFKLTVGYDRQTDILTLIVKELI